MLRFGAKWAALTAATLVTFGMPAAADVIGAFDFSRGFLSSNLVTGNTTIGFRTALANEGHMLAGTSFLSEAYLDDVDVFITGALQGSGGATSPGAATAPEIAALDDWILSGGTFIATGEHIGFVPTYNTWLNPFGIVLDGDPFNNNLNAFPILSNDISNPYLTGIAGQQFPTSNHGFYTAFPAGTTVLASGNAPAQNFIIHVEYGAGDIIAIADTHFLTDGIFNPTGINLVLNAIDAAGPTTPVPLPASLWFFAAGMAGLGGYARKRRVT